jgi:hypothetical protein
MLLAMRSARSVWLFLSLFLSIANPRVIRVQVTSREDVLQGRPFGQVGAYERIIARVEFSLDVSNRENRRIVDLDKAVNLGNDQVTFSADLIVVQPKNAEKGNGAMLLEVPNRGNPRILALVDGGDWDLAHDPGDGWLLREGYTVAGLGWQWDAAGADALRLYAPIAKENGHPITGLVRGDVMLARAREEIPLGHLILGNIGGTEYTVADPQDRRNTLTVRESRDATRTVIPRSEWQFAHFEKGTLEPSDRFIHLNGDFQRGKIYEYVYIAENPVVAGLGFAAIRDFASYVKNEKPAAVSARRVYAEGISQNGRFLRDFLFEGFNADEKERIALDGVLAHVAGAGRGNFNYRFAQPSRDAQPTSSVFYPVDIFPFTDETETDPETRDIEGLLDSTVGEHATPKIFFSNTSYEYWGRAASLIHTSGNGDRDADISANVRVYHFTGLQHFSGPFPPVRGQGDLNGQNSQSPLPVKYFWRAMIRNMNAWVRDNIDPPPNSYPRIDSSTLVALDAYRFPAIPRVNKPHEANEGYRLDFGPRWGQGIISKQPPDIVERFPVKVPQVNGDGNEMDGVRLPEITVPLATYTGWNLRDPSIGAPSERVSFEGSYLPFPKNAEERKRSGDPRLSIAERYSSRQDYLRRYRRALKSLVNQRWVLSEDVPSMMQRGEREWDTAQH